MLGVSFWGEFPQKIREPQKRCFLDTKFNVDYDFVVKLDLAWWHRQVMDVWSWGVKMAKRALSYLKFQMVIANFYFIFTESMDSRGGPSPWQSSRRWPNPLRPPLLCVPTHQPSRPPRSAPNRPPRPLRPPGDGTCVFLAPFRVGKDWTETGPD